MSDDFESLAVDFRELGGALPSKVEGVVKRGALNIKTTMREDFQASPSFRQVSRTVNFDITTDDDATEAVIGPDRRYRAARIANIAYFGSSRTGGATVDVTRGLRDEEDRLIDNIARVVGFDVV